MNSAYFFVSIAALITFVHAGTPLKRIKIKDHHPRGIRGMSDVLLEGYYADMKGFQRMMAEESPMLAYSVPMSMSMSMSMPVSMSMSMPVSMSMQMPMSMSIPMSMSLSMSYGFDGSGGIPPMGDHSNDEVGVPNYVGDNSDDVDGGHSNDVDGDDSNDATGDGLNSNDNSDGDEDSGGVDGDGVAGSNGTAAPTPTTPGNMTPDPSTASPTTQDMDGVPSDDTDGSSTSKPTPIQSGLVCVDDEVTSMGAENGAVAVPLVIGYNVESTSSSTDDFLSELEHEMVYTAIRASLDCAEGLMLSGSGTTGPLRFSVDSTVISGCTATLDETESCTLIETRINFFIHGDDAAAERAIFDAYSAIETSMADDSYVESGNVPTVIHVEYMSPLPLIDPSSVNDVPNNDPASRTAPGGPIGITTKDPSSVSGWAIGVGIAAVLGVLVAFMAWSHRRRTRHRQHVFFGDSVGMPADDTSSII